MVEPFFVLPARHILLFMLFHYNSSNFREVWNFIMNQLFQNFIVLKKPKTNPPFPHSRENLLLIFYFCQTHAGSGNTSSSWSMQLRNQFTELWQHKPSLSDGKNAQNYCSSPWLRSLFQSWKCGASMAKEGEAAWWCFCKHVGLDELLPPSMKVMSLTYSEIGV